MPRERSKPKCHPDKRVHGQGLCVNCYHYKWARDNPERSKRYQRQRLLRGTHGLSLEDYEGLAEKQNYVCAICGNTNGNRVLYVDHCHETGEIRGLLCNQCNLALGHFQDDIEKMEIAIEYLKRSAN